MISYAHNKERNSEEPYQLRNIELEIIVLNLCVTNFVNRLWINYCMQPEVLREDSFECQTKLYRQENRQRGRDNLSECMTK
jgi:hypothetical protein